MKAQRELLSIQYLRALAALLVVFYHCRQFPGFRAAIPTTIGNTGVDIFFIVSGFVMTVTAGNQTGRQFLAKRLLRIAPLYWVMTLATALLLLVLPGIFRDNSLTWHHLLWSMAFIPHASPQALARGNLDAAGTYSPLLKIGWTLNFEMFFYLVFALLLPLRTTTRIIAMAIAFAALIAFNHGGGVDWAPVNFLGDGILVEFLAGCVVGWLYREGRFAAIHPPIATLAIICAVSALIFFGSYESGLHRAIVAGIPGAVLVCGVLALEEHGRLATAASWKYLGDASYSLYLTHLSVVVLLRTIWVKARLPAQGLEPALVFTALGITLAIPVALATYFYVERPLLNTLRSHLQPLLGGRQPKADAKLLASAR